MGFEGLGRQGRVREAEIQQCVGGRVRDPSSDPFPRFEIVVRRREMAGRGEEAVDVEGRVLLVHRVRLAQDPIRLEPFELGPQDVSMRRILEAPSERDREGREQIRHGSLLGKQSIVEFLTEP